MILSYYYYKLLLFHHKSWYFFKIYNTIIYSSILNVFLKSSSTSLTFTALYFTALRVKCILRRAQAVSALHYMTQTALHCRN